MGSFFKCCQFTLREIDMGGIFVTHACNFSEEEFLFLCFADFDHWPSCWISFYFELRIIFTENSSNWTSSGWWHWQRLGPWWRRAKNLLFFKWNLACHQMWPFDILMGIFSSRISYEVRPSNGHFLTGWSYSAVLRSI